MTSKTVTNESIEKLFIELNGDFICSNFLNEQIREYFERKYEANYEKNEHLLAYTHIN